MALQGPVLLVDQLGQRFLGPQKGLGPLARPVVPEGPVVLSDQLGQRFPGPQKGLRALARLVSPGFLVRHAVLVDPGHSTLQGFANSLEGTGNRR